MKIGVLALQGGFREHVVIMQGLLREKKTLPGQKFEDYEVFEVRTKEELSECDGLIIPGGESSVMMKFIKEFSLEDEIRRLCNEGTVYGTCAGLIVLAELGLLDTKVMRNAYGRQLSSFITDLKIKNLKPSGSGVLPVGHFIRAPKIISVGDNVDVLSVHKGVPVLVKEGNLWASSFHPELSQCNAIHEMVFLS